MLASWKKSYDKPRQHIKKQRHHFANKGPSSQSYGFSSSHVWMWESDLKEGQTLKNCCFWTVVLEKTLESPLDCKEVKAVNPECSLEGLMLKLKLQYFGHLMRRTGSLERTDAGKDWMQEKKGTTENEMVGWHHWPNGHEFEQARRFSDGQGSLVCCSPWGCKEPDTTEQLNWTDGLFMFRTGTRASLTLLLYASWWGRFTTVARLL